MHWLCPSPSFYLMKSLSAVSLTFWFLYSRTEQGKSCVSVTRQHGARPPITVYAHNTKIHVEGDRFSFTGFPMVGGGREHFCSEPFFYTRHKTSLAPKKITNQRHAQKTPLLLISPFGAYASHADRSPTSLGYAPVSFQVNISLQPLSLFPSWAGVFCQVTPDGHEGEFPPARHLLVRASMLCLQFPYAALGGGGSPGLVCHDALGHRVPVRQASQRGALPPGGMAGFEWGRA